MQTYTLRKSFDKAVIEIKKDKEDVFSGVAFTSKCPAQAYCDREK